METNIFVNSIFLIFTGAAILATVALFTRQSLLVAYMLLGVLLGANGLKIVPHVALAQDIGDVGIIFLLFLLGLDLTPQDLLHTFRKTTFITVISTLAFAAVGIAAGKVMGFTWMESAIMGAAFSFSSTIIALKLLPTTALHHLPMGELMISVLLMQDILAVAFLIFIHGASMTGSKVVDIGLAAITLPALFAFAFLMQHYVIAKLFRKFDRIKEYVFLLAIAWCLGMAELSRVLGLSAEIGAFIAGVSIAEGPIAIYIAESLKPLRDFCLVMFFFAVGSTLNLQFLHIVIIPALILAAVLLLFKPWVFQLLVRWAGEPKKFAKEMGYRLGQNSEFSLLLAYLAAESMPSLISAKVNYLIQTTTLITFIVSTYWVGMRYPTPMAVDDKLRRD